ncbi:MAG: cysteine desulfurase DndA [Gammaproteobacteria bacterium]|nr:cysteine desulfurase DndA [Gammaproteobacteria bacterium]
MKQIAARTSVERDGPVYLDCNATTPIEPAVLAEMNRLWANEPGNAGSRTHEYGLRAKKLVQKAREQIAAVVWAKPEEVIFTSGATESSNIAILGLAAHAKDTGRCHIVSTEIEHKAVLEPLEQLARRGFKVTHVPVGQSGAVTADAIGAALRDDTGLVSVMHVNNETGIIQPVKEIARVLGGHPAYFHVDAAQGFGKELDRLRCPRIDLISVSSHKIFGPVGIGSLIVRRRGFERIPLRPIVFGGGQERGLRHGTLPVPLVAGIGLAAEIALRDHDTRQARCLEIRGSALDALASVGIRQNGDPRFSLPHVLNFSVDGVDAEALMVALKNLIAVSNGSACTSQSYEPSHVLAAMGLSDARIAGAVRMSWCHMTPNVDWPTVANRIASIA